VDQKLADLKIDLDVKNLDKLYLPLADKIFRCEKCFREANILDVAISKEVKVFLSCKEHGRLITREIDREIYDKIKFAWDMKDLEIETERTY
jgi:hypothetical protein